MNLRLLTLVSCVSLATACASLSNKDGAETSRVEAEHEVYEDFKEEAAVPAALHSGSGKPTQAQEVKLLHIDRPSHGRMLRGTAAKRKASPEPSRSDSVGSLRASEPSGLVDAAPKSPRRINAARGSESECDEVLGGDYWAERVRIDPALQRFFQAQSRQPFELSVYRRISSSPEEFTRVFQMDEAALRVSFVVETPGERNEESDFLYEIQLLNRSAESAEYCLKHWR